MVVKEPEARAAYEAALCRAGVCYHTAESFNEVLRMSIDAPYCGLLIDILTLVRSSKEEKSIAYDCINFYPTLRVKWDARVKSMSLSPLEQSFSSDTDAALNYFIESRCKSFAARSLRRFNRKDSYLSLLLSDCGTSPDADRVKTFTVNISQGGSFVHTTRAFAKGETVWLRFVGMPDQELVKAVVCWNIKWGGCRSIPGIGVMFDSLSQQQAGWIKKIADV